MPQLLPPRRLRVNLTGIRCRVLDRYKVLEYPVGRDGEWEDGGVCIKEFIRNYMVASVIGYD